MSVVDWGGFSEPWRDVGQEFADDILPVLCGDTIPLQPFYKWRTERRKKPQLQWFGWIAEQRHKLGLSQRELAQRVGCHPRTIGGYERGEYQPSQAMRERLAAVLLPEPQP